MVENLFYVTIMKSSRTLGSLTFDTDTRQRTLSHLNSQVWAYNPILF